MKSLDVAQQMWLQSLIASRCVSEAHAKALHKAAKTSCEMTYRPNDYDEFFSKVAKAVQIVGLEIRRSIDETKGTHVVGLVNTKGDEIAQLATNFTPHEMTFVKKLIERIIKAPYESFCIGSRDAYGIGSKLSPLIQPGKAEGICDKLINLGWLRYSKSGRYSLTPRTLMELQNYLQNTYEEYLVLCTVCEELLTNGFSCRNAECDVRVHQHCALKWEKSLKNNEEGRKACSHCHIAWETAPVGEPVMTSQYASVRQARARKMREQRDDEEGDEEDGEEEEWEEEAEEEGEEDEQKEKEDEADVQPDEERHLQQTSGRSGKRRSNGNTEMSSRRTRAKVEAEEDD